MSLFLDLVYSNSCEITDSKVCKNPRPNFLARLQGLPVVTNHLAWEYVPTSRKIKHKELKLYVSAARDNLAG